MVAYQLNFQLKFGILLSTAVLHPVPPITSIGSPRFRRCGCDNFRAIAVMSLCGSYGDDGLKAAPKQYKMQLVTVNFT